MNDTATEAPVEKSRKSIVPAKYAGRYKDGGSDALASFINENCRGKDGFNYDTFFAICRENGIPEEQVAKYEQQVADKKLGSQGRARMTLRNMLATIVRKDGKIKDADGDEFDLTLPKVALTGAAAKAAEAKQETADAPKA